MQHTEKCLTVREKERAELIEYKKVWPKYCRHCGGEGGHTDYEYRGECHRIPASEQIFDYCPHCVEQGICPRCGSVDTNFFTDEACKNLSCDSCKWREGMAGAPEVEGDCGCYEDALDFVHAD